MSEGQLYRLRAPSSGRELLLAAEPGKVYTDHDTGETARGRREGPPAAPVEVQSAMGRRHVALLQLVRPARTEGPQRLPHVRPPDGRAAPLRGGRMRFAPSRLAVGIFALTLAVAGCGGSTDHRPGSPGRPRPADRPRQRRRARPAGDRDPDGRGHRDGRPERRRGDGHPRRGRHRTGHRDRSAGNRGRRNHGAGHARIRRRRTSRRRPAPTPTSSRTSALKTLAPADRGHPVPSLKHKGDGRSIRSSLVLGRHKSCASHPKPEPTTSVCSTASPVRPLSRPLRLRSAVRSKSR